MSNAQAHSEANFSISIEGLNCGHCVMQVEHKLKELGASSIDINLDRKQANFNLAQEEQLAEVLFNLKQSGFPATRLVDKKNLRVDYFHWIVAACCALTAPLLLHMFVSWHWLHDPWVQLLLSTPVVLFSLYHFGISAYGSLKRKSLNMDVLVVTGVSASYIYSIAGLVLNLGPDYLFFETAASITCFVLIGNLLEKRSLKSTTSALTELAKLQIVPAKRVILHAGSEKVEEVDARLVKQNDTLRINKGDRVPVDGVILSGSLYLDESMITGESEPVYKASAANLIGGSLVTDGSATFKVTNVGSQSVLGQMIAMVRDAQSSRPPIQRMGDIVSSWFVPAVFIVAITTFLVTSLALNLTFQDSFLRAVAVLVIACPCAMGLATPTAISVALGRAAKLGIFFKSAPILESLAKIKSIAFDKTGTLTSSIQLVHENIEQQVTEEEFRSLIYTLELRSSHPLAQAIVGTYENLNLPVVELLDFTEERGLGVFGKTSTGHTLALGSKNICPPDLKLSQTHQSSDLFLLKDNQIIGSLQLSESLKPTSSHCVDALQKMNLDTFIVSGDRQEKVKNIAEQLGIDKYYAQQTPSKKLATIEQLQNTNELAYIGDGINDAPALSKATVGIALSDATQIALQSADILIHNHELGRVVDTIQLSRKTLTIIKQNLFWAFFYNVAAIPLAAAGYLTPMLAAIVMALSDVIVIGNSLRLKTIKLDDVK